MFGGGFYYLIAAYQRAIESFGFTFGEPSQNTIFFFFFYCNHFLALHLQSTFVEHFSSLQDAGTSGHCVLNDQTGISFTEYALHQTPGS